jgi:hypothetical protein
MNLPRSLSLAVLCLVLAAGTVTGCRTAPLVDPPRTQVAATPELTRAAIIRALVRFNYQVDEESPGRIRARLARNAWVMIVEISYDRDVSVRYADSVGLDYEVKDDVAYIHKNYNSRADQLLKEIQRQVMIAGLENRGLPSVSQPKPTPAAPSP